MAVFVRDDSPFFQMLLEGTGERLSTKIPKTAATAKVRKQLREQAQIIYNAAMVERARARYDLPSLTPETITFAKYADWFDTHVIAKRRGTERDRLSLKHLRTFFGSRDLTAIDRSATMEYATARLAARVGPPPKPGRDDTRRTVSPSTVNREIDLLKQMLTAAVPKYLKASPLAGMKRLRIVKRKKRIIQSGEEERRLLSVMTPIDRAFYLVARDSLMRLSNVIDLRRDEDRGSYFALSDSKTGPYEAVISIRVRKALDAIPLTGPYYFPHRRKGKTAAARRKAVSQWLKRKCHQAKIPYGRGIGGVTFHTATRATGATRLLREGADLRTLQEAGNWRDIRSVQEYLHADHARLKEAMNAGAPAHDLTEAEAEVHAARRERLRSAGRKGMETIQRLGKGHRFTRAEAVKAGREGGHARWGTRVRKRE